MIETTRAATRVLARVETATALENDERVGSPLESFRAAGARTWLKLARYFESCISPPDDTAEAVLRAVTGGIGAPVLLPAAQEVSRIHEKYTPIDGVGFPRPDGARRAVLVLATDAKTFGGIQRYAWTWAQALYDLGYLPRTAVVWRSGVLAERKVAPHRAAAFACSAACAALARRPIATICTHIGLSPIGLLIKRAFGIPYAVSLHGDDSWRTPRSKAVERALREADILIPVSHFTKDVVVSTSGIPSERFYVTGSILSPQLELAARRMDPTAYENDLSRFYTLRHRTNDAGAEALPDTRASTEPSERSADLTTPSISLASLGHTSSSVEAVDGTEGPRPTRRSKNKPRARHRLVTVARLDANSFYKRHDLVIRAVAVLARDFPDLEYLVVGDGSYRPTLENLADEVGVTDRVRFLGKRPEAELVELLASSTCLVMPSRISLDPAEGEGFGLVYLEAGIFETPSVAARAGGSTETVLDGVTGLLAEPDSLDSLVYCLRRLLSDAQLAEQLGRAARLRALEFSYPRFRSRCAAVMEAITHSTTAADATGKAAATRFPEYPRDSLF